MNGTEFKKSDWLWDCAQFENMQVVKIVEKVHTQNSFDFYSKLVMHWTIPGVGLSATSEA